MQKQLSAVLETTKQGSESSSKEWIETSIWTRNMLTALDNGVKGGKWFSLIDKVYSLKTLNIAWEQVKSNKGSAGIDRVSIEKFEHKAQIYLQELEQSLKEQSYNPMRKLSTREPYARESHVRFGGRGEFFPTPIHFDQFDTEIDNLERFGEQYLALQSIERSKTRSAMP